jgi:hypothetical protein
MHPWTLKKYFKHHDREVHLYVVDQQFAAQKETVLLPVPLRVRRQPMVGVSRYRGRSDRKSA